MKQFFGKYRGKVVNNQDPQRLGRLQVSVPSVYGDVDNNWAAPCVPYAGSNVGIYFMPPIGANIWVEFEGGDVDYPIWSGCFWGEGIPSPSSGPDQKVIKTPAGTLTLSDAPGNHSLVLETQGKKITLNPSTIEITFGSCSVTMTQNLVSVNGQALEVSA